MIKKIAYTMYPVKDIERARSFYETVLALKPGSISVQGKWVEYDLPEGGCFAITSYVEGVEPSSVAGGSVAFEVDNLDEFVAELKTKNVIFKMDVIDTPVCRMAVALDSEGNGFILHQLKK